MRKTATFVTVLTLTACGGRIASESRSAMDAGFADAHAIPAFDGGDACSPGGVRLCGASCNPGDCAACTPLVKADGGTAGYGVCWPDLADGGNTPCALCDDGQGCVRRGPHTYVCVPLDVCGALLTLGVSDVCWYGDKVPFNGPAVPPAVGCPDDSYKNVCGGDCPPCNALDLQRCVGRGPNHPFGTCPFTCGGGADLGSYPTCSVSAGGMVPCPDVPCADYLCAVSPYPPGDPAVAPLTGLCLRDCPWLATTLPGALWCFDASGRRVAP